MEHTTFGSLNQGDLFISVGNLKRSTAEEGRPLLKKVNINGKDMALHVFGSGLIFGVPDDSEVIVVLC